MGEKPKQLGFGGFHPQNSPNFSKRREYYCIEDEAKKNQGFNINNT
jgi:hypothetical protein